MITLGVTKIDIGGGIMTNTPLWTAQTPQPSSWTATYSDDMQTAYVTIIEQ